MYPVNHDAFAVFNGLLVVDEHRGDVHVVTDLREGAVCGWLEDLSHLGLNQRPHDERCLSGRLDTVDLGDFPERDTPAGDGIHGGYTRGQDVSRA